MKKKTIRIPELSHGNHANVPSRQNPQDDDSLKDDDISLLSVAGRHLDKTTTAAYSFAGPQTKPHTQLRPQDSHNNNASENDDCLLLGVTGGPMKKFTTTADLVTDN